MKKLWIWYWKEYGYNSTECETKEEAIEIAKLMSKNVNLEVDEKSVHEGTYEELKKLDTIYGVFVD